MSSISEQLKNRQAMEERHRREASARQAQARRHMARGARVAIAIIVLLVMAAGASLVLRATAGPEQVYRQYLATHLDRRVIEATSIIDANVATGGGSSMSGTSEYALSETDHRVLASYVCSTGGDAMGENSDASETAPEATPDMTGEPDDSADLADSMEGVPESSAEQPAVQDTEGDPSLGAENDETSLPEGNVGSDGPDGLVEPTATIPDSDEATTDAEGAVAEGGHASDANDDSVSDKQLSDEADFTDGAIGSSSESGQDDVSLSPNLRNAGEADGARLEQAIAEMAQENQVQDDRPDGGISFGNRDRGQEDSQDDQSASQANPVPVMNVSIDIALYDPNPEGLYYVALMDRLKALGRGSVTDIGLSHNGEAVYDSDDILYDSSAGILYVYKDTMMLRDGNEIEAAMTAETDATEEEILPLLMLGDDEAREYAVSDEPAPQEEEQETSFETHIENEQVLSSEDAGVFKQSQVGARMFTGKMEDLSPDMEMILKDYVQSEAKKAKTGTDEGDDEDTDEQAEDATWAFYAAIAPHVEGIASGSEHSAIFSVPAGYLVSDYDGPWTASDLGIDVLLDADGHLTEEAIDSAYGRLGDVDFGTVLDALQINHQYDLYWYDQSLECSGRSFTYVCSYQDDQWVIGFDLTKDVTLSIPVHPIYAPGEARDGNVTRDDTASMVSQKVSSQVEKGAEGVELDE